MRWGAPVRVGQAAPDRRVQQVRLGLVDAAHHQANTGEGRLDRVGVADVDPAAPRALPERYRQLVGLLRAPARYDYPTWVVGCEIRRHAASHGAVAAGDQDVGITRQRMYLPARAKSRFPGANVAAGSG